MNNRSMKYAAASLGMAVGISQCGVALAAPEMKNTEMVYVFQDAKGEVDKVIVSDWLSNPDGEDTYNQMECEEPLPVEMAISYRLDGKETDPEELVGKSGHIAIRYDFENKQKTEVEAEDGKKSVSVPFVTVTGMLLDNDKFTNVEISNGKIINDGDHTAVIGVAFPGLLDNLSLDPEKDMTIEIPGYVELEADVTDFSMEMSATCVSNGLMAEISNSENTFIQDLGQKVTSLVDGATSLSDGADSINTGMTTLNEGITTLSTGLNTISGNSETLTTGALQVFQSLLDTASAQLTEAGADVPELTVENYAEVLEGLLIQMNPETLTAQATEQVTAAVAEQMRPQVAEKVILSALNMSKKDYEAACTAGMVTEEQQTMIDQAIEDTMANDENVKTQLEAIVSEQLNTPELQEKLAAASAGYEKISGLKASLDSYQTFYQGVVDYAGGVDEAAAGAADLLKGAGQLAEGASGLADGAAALKEGLHDTDISTTIADIENMLKAAGTYSNYSGQNSEVDGEVCFIYRTAEIG